MKRKLISIFLILILLFYTCSFVFAENITNEEQTNEEEQNDGQSLIDKQKELTEQIDAANTRLEYVQSELSSTMLRVQELEDRVLEYQTQMTDLSGKLDTLQGSITSAKENLEMVLKSININNKL